MNIFLFSLILFGANEGELGLRFSRVDNGPDIPQWNGFYIWHVSPNSPASKAGILVNDQVLEVNGKQVKSFSDIYSEVKNIQVGEKVYFTLARASRRFVVELIAGPKGGEIELEYSDRFRSYPHVVHPSDPWLDFEVTESLSGAIFLKNVGPTLVHILQKKDRILTVDGKEVSSVAQFYSILKTYNPGDEINLTIQRGGKPATVDMSIQTWGDCNRLTLDWR